MSVGTYLREGFSLVERKPSGLKTLRLCGDWWHLSQEAREEGVYPEMQVKWPGDLLHLHLKDTLCI